MLTFPCVIACVCVHCLSCHCLLTGTCSLLGGHFDQSDWNNAPVQHWDGMLASAEIKCRNVLRMLIQSGLVRSLQDAPSLYLFSFSCRHYDFCSLPYWSLVAPMCICSLVRTLSQIGCSHTSPNIGLSIGHILCVVRWRHYLKHCAALHYTHTHTH